MTFLSLTSEAYLAPTSRPATRAVPRAPFAGQVVAACLVIASLTVPGAVAQAKWTKLTLILSIAQHRCMASFTD